MPKPLVYIVLALPLVGAYSMFALGIVVIWRASRVLNLAHGAMATVPAYVSYSLWKAGVPVGYALVVAIAFGALLGIAVERFVLRPLRASSQTTQTVGTAAVLGVLVAITAKIWGTTPLNAPGLFPEGHIAVGHSLLHFSEIGLACVAAVVAVATGLLFTRTGAGLAMRAAADNRRASALMGIDPDRTTMIAWALGGALAALAGVLLAGATNLEPYQLSYQVLPAFVAALTGGLGSLQGAVVGAAIVGAMQGLVQSFGAIGRQAGFAQLVLTGVALIVMATRGKKLATAAESAGTTSAMPRSSRRKISAGTPWLWIAFALYLAFPWLPVGQSIAADINNAAIYVIVGVSLVILTGWVGQISLAQAAFVGIGAFATGLLVRGAHIPFPLNLPLAAAVAAAASALLGIVALRVRGLYLAVATLIFGWMCDSFLFNQQWLVGAGGSSVIGAAHVGRGAISFDLTNPRIFFYIAAGVAAAAVVAAANLRDSRIGRALFAVRGSEVAAASLGIDVTRTKLFAFTLSGLIAGIAGSLMMTMNGTANKESFMFQVSLLFLAIVVVGGSVRLGGVIAAAALFAGLNELYYRFPIFHGYIEIVSSGLLFVAVMASSPAIAGKFRKTRAEPASSGDVLLQEPNTARATTGPSDVLTTDALEATGLTVRFGGLVAVDGASLVVGAGELVGLIGPNGAGKTTLFNAIGGLNSPTSGTVSIFGRDATSLGVHQRAQLGIGRTFQQLQLFSDATVFENLLVATHLQGKTNPLQSLFVTNRSLRNEADARDRVNETIEIAGLQSVAGERVADLPFGVLRMVEVARALVTGARLLLLDEPASGLDERETKRLHDLLVALREGLGLSMLVVEHDVVFVTSLSDRLYVLDQGRIIAHGTPEETSRDPKVIAAYLGTAPDSGKELSYSA